MVLLPWRCIICNCFPSGPNWVSRTLLENAPLYFCTPLPAPVPSVSEISPKNVFPPSENTPLHILPIPGRKPCCGYQTALSTDALLWFVGVFHLHVQEPLMVLWHTQGWCLWLLWAGSMCFQSHMEPLTTGTDKNGRRHRLLSKNASSASLSRKVSI